MQNQLEQTLDSREVAEMIEKDHSKLLRDLWRYEEQFTEAKIGFSNFLKKYLLTFCTPIIIMNLQSAKSEVINIESTHRTSKS